MMIKSIFCLFAKWIRMIERKKMKTEPLFDDDEIELFFTQDKWFNLFGYLEKKVQQHVAGYKWKNIFNKSIE